MASPNQAGYPTTVPIGHYGRLVQGPAGRDELPAYGRGEGLRHAGHPDQWPSGRPQGTLGTTDPFTIVWRDGRTQKIPGKLYLVWPKDNNLWIGPGTGDLTFATGIGMEQQSALESGYSEKYSLGMETKLAKGIFTSERERSWGTESSSSNVTTWGKDVEFEGNINGFEHTDTPIEMAYTVLPYVWTQKSKMEGGGYQQYLVLDYYVPEATTITPTAGMDPPAAEKPARLGPAVAPGTPEITSSTHPDQDTWYGGSAATFSWGQPAGDPATVTQYHWILDGARIPSRPASTGGRSLPRPLPCWRTASITCTCAP